MNRFVLYYRIALKKTTIYLIFNKNICLITLDFDIGNKNFLGPGLASSTLAAFIKFYHKYIDPLSDTFFIDPDENNPRAMHVYSKAGFKQVGEYTTQSGAFKGNTSYLMIRNILT
ncbi:acetyltransferase domain protein [Rickettsia rhipicephali str. Ect]|uniref:Acetyltransferase domain protein n=1 Tax=Rickettsia rhipicephali str. Ect TaxID=1359199 RepID=A0A0F3PE18_RICRH|nr:GNAT family N-acetyltransferase [Rickettsia massiliae]KJV78570.1 acetyltransferase domain protein [Rickettsia rhipicephali str. Ect]